MLGRYSEFYETAMFGVKMGLFSGDVWQYLLQDVKSVKIVAVHPYYAALSKLDWENELDCHRLTIPSNLDDTRGIWGANGYRGDGWYK